jgi:hypothetical protein
MYVARFDVEFRKDAGGWEYVRLHAREEFKGESGPSDDQTNRVAVATGRHE